MEKTFYPTLDDESGGVVDDPIRMLHHLVSFIFMNPGDTSETHEAQMGSLGIIHMQHGESPGVLASEYERMLQQKINITFGVGVYTASVSSESVSDTEFKLNLLVTDNVGENVLTDSKELRRLIGE